MKKISRVDMIIQKHLDYMKNFYDLKPGQTPKKGILPVEKPKRGRPKSNSPAGRPRRGAATGDAGRPPESEE